MFTDSQDDSSCRAVLLYVSFLFCFIWLSLVSFSSSSVFLLSVASAVRLRFALRNLARARPLASSQRVCAAMGPQPCPGPCTDGTLTELAAETVRSKWAQSEGVKWEWRTSDVQHTKCAWWRLCVPCHRLAWPLPPSFVQGAGGHSQKKEALAVKVLSQTTPAAAPQSRASYLRKPQ